MKLSMCVLKMETVALRLLAVLVAGLGTAEAGDFTKWDPRMAAVNSITDTNGIKWIDGRYLPIEGRAFTNVVTYYERLPQAVTTNVNPGVRSAKRHTSGMQFRFTTTSPWICCRWVPSERMLSSSNMASSGVSGIDIYTQDEDGKWLFTKAGRIRESDAWPTGVVDRVRIRPGTPILINLPLYNGLRSFALGIDAAGTVAALGPRKSGVVKPVVFYGTSITHGGCASRPGLAFVNQVGRDLDVPVVNLGFSGCGWMEYEMSEHLAAIESSCYVLDCLWNMTLTEEEDTKRRKRSVAKNYEPFIRNLRAKRPGVPIVMAEQCDVFCKGPNEKDRFIRTLYERLIAEGWTNLIYLPKTRMHSDDREGTVDGCHPNDWGMMSMSKAFGEAVRMALTGTLGALGESTACGERAFVTCEQFGAKRAGRQTTCPPSSSTVATTVRSDDGSHDYGRPSHMGRRIAVEGLQIENGEQGVNTSSFVWFHADNTKADDPKVPYAYHLPKEVTVRNITVSNGTKPLPWNNEALFGGIRRKEHP